MYCKNCGKVVVSLYKFCSNCGCGINEPSTSLSTPSTSSSTSTSTFATYMETMGKRRTSNFSKKRKLDNRNCQETTIYASMMRKDEEGNFKQEKSSRLPVKVESNWGPYDLHCAVFENLKDTTSIVRTSQKNLLN